MTGDVRLWHDDVRPPPQGWVWARTNDAAKTVLRYDNVVECSLDHDLGLEHLEVPDEWDDDAWDKVIEVANSLTDKHSETGLDLVLWMIQNDRVPAEVRIHSWNPDGAKFMAAALNRAGHDCYVSPFSPKERA